MNSGHISVFVNVTHLKTVYSEQLAAADDQLEQFIDMMASQVTAASPEVDIDYVLSMYRDLGTGILQTVRDSESLIVSISIEEDVLQIEELLTVEEGSSTDTLLSSQPVSDLQLLQSLPEGQTGYAATHMNPGPLFGWAETMLTGMIQDEDSREQLLKSLQIFRQAESATIAWGGGVFPDEDEAMRYFAVSRFQPASVMQDAIEVLGDELSYDIGGIHQSMILQRDVAEIDGHSVHRYQIDQELPPALDPLGIQRRINAKLYGQDEITQYLVFRDDTNLQTMGGGTDSMKQLMTADSWTDPGLLAARQRFPDQASLIVLGDLPEFIINMGRLMLESGALPIPIEAETLAGFEVPPSYAGFSVTAEPQHLHARTVIPVGTVQAFAKIAQFAQQAIPGSP